MLTQRTEKEISQQIKLVLLDEFNNQNRKGLYAYTQKSMAYNSNKIEGSTLTSEQTASLFDTGEFVSNGVEVYRAKDVEEMNGHFKMFNEMLKRINEPLSPDLIKIYHYQLKSGVFEDIANGYPIGEYKNRANTVSDITVAKPSEVPQMMQKLIDEYNSSNKTLKDITRFHAEYENIHPFQDGNGRTGRIIIFKQCIDSELIPVIVKDKDKAFYIRALHKAQTENDYNDLINIFEKSQKEYGQKAFDYIEGYKKQSPLMENTWLEFVNLSREEKRDGIEWNGQKMRLAVFEDMYLAQCGKEGREPLKEISDHFWKVCVEINEYKPNFCKRIIGEQGSSADDYNR